MPRKATTTTTSTTDFRTTAAAATTAAARAPSYVRIAVVRWTTVVLLSVLVDVIVVVTSAATTGSAAGSARQQMFRDERKQSRPEGIQMMVSDEKRLIKKLLDEYEESGAIGRPVYNTSQTIRISYGLSLIQILDVDEKNQVLTTNVWSRYTWNDILLAWNPNEYGGLDTIRVPASKIWTPDIVLYNYADSRLKEQRETMVVVTYNGSVLWIPPAIFKSTCLIDITHFPFDVQTCNMKFGSWTYDGDSVDVVFYDDRNEVDTSDYIVSNEWELLAHPARRNVRYYMCCGDLPFIDLTFTIKIRRLVVFYNYILILPCVLLSLLTPVVFWLPPESPAKTMLGMNVFVAFFVLLILLSDNSPPVATRIPLIGAYFCVNMTLITLSTFLTVVVIHTHVRYDRRNRVPDWLRRLVIDGIGRSLCMSECLGRVETAVRSGGTTTSCSSTSKTSNRSLARRLRQRLFGADGLLGSQDGGRQTRRHSWSACGSTSDNHVRYSSAGNPASSRTSNTRYGESSSDATRYVYRNVGTVSAERHVSSQRFTSFETTERGTSPPETVDDLTWSTISPWRPRTIDANEELSKYTLSNGRVPAVSATPPFVRQKSFPVEHSYTADRSVRSYGGIITPAMSTVTLPAMAEVEHDRRRRALFDESGSRSLQRNGGSHQPPPSSLARHNYTASAEGIVSDRTDCWYPRTTTASGGGSAGKLTDISASSGLRQRHLRCSCSTCRSGGAYDSRCNDCGGRDVESPSSSSTVPPLISRQMASDVRDIRRLLRAYSFRLGENDSRNQMLAEWRLVARVLDRLFFVVYCTAVFISMATVLPRGVESDE